MENTQQSILATELEQLIRKAADANMEILTESGKFMTRMLTQKVEIKDLFALNNKVFSNAMNDLVRINIHHTTNLIDWGVKISKDFASQFTGTTQDESQVVEDEKPEATAVTKFELHLSGKKGDTAQTTFSLHSDKDGPVNGHFIVSPLVNEPGGEVLNSSAQLSPQEFEINNTEAIQVEASVKIPENAVTGIYRSRIQVIGFDHTEFYLVLTIEESASDIKPETPAKIPFKKKVIPKKTLKKK